MPENTMRLMRALRHTTPAAINLRQRRAWFDEDQTGQNPTNSQPNQPAPEKEEPERDSGSKLPDWVRELASEPEKLYSEIRKLRSEAKEHRTKADEVSAKLTQKEIAEKQATENELKEQNKWKELAEQRQADLEKVQAEVKRERLDLLRLKVGIAHKLPDALIARLQGETEDDLKADAEALVAALGLDKQPETPAQPEQPTQSGRKPATTTANPTGQPVGVTDAQRRASRMPQVSPMFENTNTEVRISDGSRLIIGKKE
jgi:hypothetical protein